MPKKKVQEINIAEIFGARREVFTQELTVYMAHMDSNGKSVPKIKEWVEEAQEVVTRFGGGTTTLPPADGTWFNPISKKIIWEKTSIISCFIDPSRFTQENVKELREFLHRYGRETKQGEVAIMFDGEFYKIHKFDRLS